jgi:hypothetical protein
VLDFPSADKYYNKQVNQGRPAIFMDHNFSEKYALAVAILLALVFFAQGFFGNFRQSLTWDETDFISAGYVYLTQNDFRLNPSHPPLMQELEAFPLLFLNVEAPPYPSHWLTFMNPVLAYGENFLFRSGNDARRMGFWGRLPVLILGALLILGIYLWGSRMFGALPALAATAAAAFCPNLIAHSKVATEDLGCTALMFAAVWTFWLGWHKKRMQSWLLCGLVTGLALLSKYTALLLGPIYLVLTAWLLEKRHFEITPMSALKALAIIGCVSFIVVGAGYNFTFDWSKYVSGISKIYSDTNPGYKFYLLGRVSDKPWWYYNLVGLATKVPVATLLLFVIAAASWIYYRKEPDSSMFLLVPAAFIIGSSFFDKQNLGLRRILPALPFLLLFSAQAFGEGKNKFRLIVVLILLAWTASEAVSIYPYHLSYFNTIAGGPKRGPFLFDDSNIDWGQDLPALSEWQRSHPESIPLKLKYFGTASPSAYGVDAVEFDKSDIEYPKPGVYAVSAHILVFFRKCKAVTGADIDWLTKYKPIARAGYSIYIYKF